MINSLRYCLKLNGSSFSLTNNSVQFYFWKSGKAFALSDGPTCTEDMQPSCIYCYDSPVHLGAEMGRTCEESGGFQEKSRLHKALLCVVLVCTVLCFPTPAQHLLCFN